MRRSQKYGIIGSVIACALVILLVSLIYFYPNHKEEEGIMISFGDSDDGGGWGNQQAESSESASAPAKPVPSVPSPSETLTQKTDDAPAVEKPTKTPVEQKKPKVQVDEEEIKRRQEAEEKRLQEEKKKEEEAKKAKQEQEAREKANKLGGALGGLQGGNGSGEKTDGAGSGKGTSDSRQGNPTGHGTDSRGNSWSLEGRTMTGSFPRPSNDFKEGGTIVVEIMVDEKGKVISATAKSHVGITNLEQIRKAEEAARKAQFSAGSSVAVGTITYKYKIN